MWSISGGRRGAGLRWALALAFLPAIAFAHGGGGARAGVNDLYVLESSAYQVQVVRTDQNGIPKTNGAVIPIGNSSTSILSQARATPDNKSVWVIDTANAQITVIDTYSKNTSTFSIGTVGTSYPAFLVFSPAGDRAYITNEGTNTVTVVNTYTKTVIGNPIPVGCLPGEIAITPDGSKLYVPNIAGPVSNCAQTNPPPVVTTGSVSVIDTAQLKVVATVTVPCNGPNHCVPTTGSNPIDYSSPSPTGIRVSADGQFVYVTDAYDYNVGASTGNYQPVQKGQVTIISTATNSIVKTIPNSGGYAPGDVGFSADGSTAFVANGGNDNYPYAQIGVINTAAQNLTNVFTEPTPATGAAEVDPAGCNNLIYVANYGTGSGGESVVTINAATQQGISVFTLPQGSFPQSLAVVPVSP